MKLIRLTGCIACTRGQSLSPRACLCAGRGSGSSLGFPSDAGLKGRVSMESCLLKSLKKIRAFCTHFRGNTQKSSRTISFSHRCKKALAFMLEQQCCSQLLGKNDSEADNQMNQRFLVLLVFWIQQSDMPAMEMLFMNHLTILFQYTSFYYCFSRTDGWQIVET